MNAAIRYLYLKINLGLSRACFIPDAIHILKISNNTTRDLDCPKFGPIPKTDTHLFPDPTLDYVFIGS